ncbi:MAG TPA: nucleotidyltransferase domain-containing protein [Chloroflexia bacterium]
MRTLVRSRVTNRLLQDIVERLVEIARPEKIVLFGSRARGDNRPDSDIDLLVIASSDEPRHIRSRAMYAALSDIRVSTDIVVYTPEEVYDWSEVWQALVTSALREGRVLYERSSREANKDAH